MSVSVGPLSSGTVLVEATDQPWFAELNVIRVLQPLWARWDDYMRLTADRVGRRSVDEVNELAVQRSRSGSSS